MISVNDDYTNESDDEDFDGNTDDEDDEEENDSGDELANLFLDSEYLSPDDNNGNVNENESFVSMLLLSSDCCGYVNIEVLCCCTNHELTMYS